MIERVKILTASTTTRDQNHINAHAMCGKIHQMNRI